MPCSIELKKPYILRLPALGLLAKCDRQLESIARTVRGIFSIKLEQEIRAQIIGVNHQMTTFEHYFGVKPGSLLSKHSDKLSKTLQKKKLSAAEGQSGATLRIKTLEKMRTDDSNHLFWERCIKEAKDLAIGEVLLPRKRQRPLGYYFGNATVEFLDSVENHCRSIYYEEIDTAISCIEKLFEQNDYTTYYSKLAFFYVQQKGNHARNFYPLSATFTRTILISTN